MDKGDGVFGKNFLSLQLQLNTLFEESGGERAISLLDALSRLSSAEQKIALSLFSNVISRISSGDIRLFSEEDKALQKFEDELYQEVLEDMRKSMEEEITLELEGSKPDLKILKGGKGYPESVKSPISIEKARGLRAEK